MSINLVTNVDSSHQSERQNANSRWKKVDGVMSSRKAQLSSALDSSVALEREVNRIADTVKHYEQKRTSNDSPNVSA